MHLFWEGMEAWNDLQLPCFIIENPVRVLPFARLIFQSLV